jgi:hypothetical protein
MKRKAYGRDAGLSFRMLFTTSMLGLLYVLFAVALFFVLNAGIVLMVVIVGGTGLRPVLHLRQARLEGRGREGRRARPGAGACTT